MKRAFSGYSLIAWSILFAVAVSFFPSCGSPGERHDIDRSDSGTIHISVDESFEPVIKEEIKVFEALYPKTKIIAEYKPEGECLKDLDKDSTRMIIITRRLTRDEEKYYKDKLFYYPPQGLVALDAVAAVVNKNSPDTIIRQANLRSILDGSIGGNNKVVFDGVKGSGVFRYVEDSVLRGRKMDTNRVFGVRGSKEVLENVKRDKNLIGLLGVSWIGNPEDTSQLSFLMNVNIASINCNCPEKSFVKPYQYNILTFRYPYVRGIFYVVKENYAGVGRGFANFMESERGQLIFKRAYLVPAKMSFNVRSATTN